MRTPDVHPIEKRNGLVLSLLLVTLLWNAFPSATRAQVEALAPAPKTQWPLTVAESSDYQATSSSADVEDFLIRITQAASHLELSAIGRTDEGRSIWCVHNAGIPEQGSDAADSERMRVVVIGNIHSGECAGKEALLELLRTLAKTPDHPWLQSTELYVIPNYSADANDRLGADHRPGQVGPSHGMGLRETPAGLDLNRDFMKLEAPETRALVRLFNRIDPHVFIDCHTTNGSRHRYKLTYDVPHHPATSAALRALLREDILPTVTQRLHDDHQIDTFYYGNFNRDRTRWSTYGYEPRYSTEYAGMRGILGVLSEAYSYATYQERIDATREFVRGVIDRCIELQPQVLSVTQDAKHNANRGQEIALTAELAPFEQPTTVLGYGQEDAPQTIEVEFWGRYESQTTTQLTAEYWLAADQSWIAERLAWHGIPVYTLNTPVARDVESFLVQKVQKAERSFQGHVRPRVEISRRLGSVEFPAGTYVVKTSEGGRLLAALMEPQACDSLLSWNFLDEYLQPGTSLPYYRSAQETPGDQLTVLKTIAPTELLTLDKIYGTAGRVNYSGTSRSVKWEEEGDWYQQTVDGRTTRTEASSGNQQRVEPAIASQAIVNALKGLEGLTEDEAQALASSARKEGRLAKGQLFKHQGNLIYIDHATMSARWLTRTEAPQELEERDPTETRVAYVRSNNLYVQKLLDGEEIALTEDGSDTLFNGKLDWVYQEELYGRGNFKGFWWSPSGRFLALLRLDEKEVHRFTVTDHIPTRQQLEVTSYPKAGDPNPTVSIGMIDVETGEQQWLDLAPSNTPEPLISRVGWHPQRDQLVFQVQDRVQTFLDVYVTSPEEGRWKTERWFREASPAWIESPGQPHWLSDGSFLWLSSRSGTQQVYHYDATGELIKAVTSGPGEVRDLLKVDENLQELWVSATFDSLVERHTYRISFSGDKQIRLTELGWDHSTLVSPTGNYLIDTCSTASRPTQVRLLNREGELQRLLNPNSPDRLRHVRISEPEFLQVEARDGHRLDAMLILPPDFDPTNKYPVLVHVYSGPQAPTVRNAWRGTTYLWHQLLAQQGYVIWMCDNRSATYGGAAAAWPIHRDLGTQELADIEDGLQWLIQHDWIDAERVGIWGWSYGGYMTAFALTHSKMFKAGIAGAPVTDWANYDTIYTERYMGRPQDNQEGYERSSVVKTAANLDGHLLLIHGAMDDNVHLTNTLQLSYELQRAGKDFELMIYPKSRHGVTQPDLRRHLRGLMTEFLKAHL